MKMMIAAGILALSASSALAQTNPAPQPAAPAPSAAPAQTGQAAPAPSAAPAPAGQAAAQPAGGPANICQELVAFMKAPPPEAPAAAAPAKPAAAPAQGGQSQDKAPAQQADQAQQKAPAQAAPAQKEAPAQQGSSALAGTTSAGEGASPKPQDEKTSAQAVTGQDGVATDAPEKGKDNAAAGSVANAPQKESRAAPLPPADVTSTPKETVMTVKAAEELAAGGDLAACQDMARKMRVAGVSMPPPLIALAALDLKYQQNSGAGAAPAGAAAPAGNQQAPAANQQAPAANQQTPAASGQAPAPNTADQ